MVSTCPIAWKCGGVVHSSPPSSTPKTNTTKTKKPKTPTTHRHRNKPGINELYDASMVNVHRLRRRPTRTLVPAFYNEKRLAHGAAGVETGAPKQTRMSEPPVDQASINIQHGFDHGSLRRIAQLKREYPNKFNKDGKLKNRKVYPTLPHEKLKRMHERKDRLPQEPGVNISEEYRYGSAKKRLEMKDEWPEYAEYFRSRKAIKIPKVSRVSPSREGTESEEPSVPARPGINQRDVYTYGTAAQKARLRKEVPGCRKWFDKEDGRGGAMG